MLPIMHGPSFLFLWSISTAIHRNFSKGYWKQEFESMSERKLLDSLANLEKALDNLERAMQCQRS